MNGNGWKPFAVQLRIPIPNAQFLETVPFQKVIFSVRATRMPFQISEVPAKLEDSETLKCKFPAGSSFNRLPRPPHFIWLGVLQEQILFQHFQFQLWPKILKERKKILNPPETLPNRWSGQLLFSLICSILTINLGDRGYILCLLLFIFFGYVGCIIHSIQADT